MGARICDAVNATREGGEVTEVQLATIKQRASEVQAAFDIEFWDSSCARGAGCIVRPLTSTVSTAPHIASPTRTIALSLTIVCRLWQL